MSLTEDVGPYNGIFLVRVNKLDPYTVFANVLGICGLLNIGLIPVFEIKIKTHWVIKEIVSGFDDSIWVGLDFYPTG